MVRAMQPDGLRVLMLTPDFPYLDRRIAQEAGTLARQGHEVEIAPVFGDLLVDPMELFPGVTIRARPAGLVPRRSAPYRAARWFYRTMRDRLRWHRIASATYRLGANVQSLFGEVSVTLANANLEPLLQGARHDVVFAHDIPVLPLAVKLKEAWGATLVCDLHEIYPEQDEVGMSHRTKEFWRRIEAEFLPVADGILCVNPAVETYVRARYPIRGPLGVVYNSVPFYTPRSGPSWELHDLYGIEHGRQILVYAGTLRRNASLEVLVSGFVKAAVPDWVLVLLGTGELESELRERVTRHSASDRVFLGKRVAPSELVRVLSSARAGVLPYEALGFNHEIATPNKLFEYIEARLPIATSRLPQVKKIVEKLGNAAFVEFTSVDAAAAGIASFLLDRVNTIGPRELESAAREVCWERDETTVLRVFHESMAARFAPPT